MVKNDQKLSQVQSVKIFGTRDMNMDPNAKTLFDEIDYSNFNFANKFTKPYFNDAQENLTFKLLVCFEFKRMVKPLP